MIELQSQLKFKTKIRNYINRNTSRCSSSWNNRNGIAIKWESSSHHYQMIKIKSNQKIQIFNSINTQQSRVNTQHSTQQLMMRDDSTRTDPARTSAPEGERAPKGARHFFPPFFEKISRYRLYFNRWSIETDRNTTPHSAIRKAWQSKIKNKNIAKKKSFWSLNTFEWKPWRDNCDENFDFWKKVPNQGKP